jgi:hypothetical protein
MAYTDIDDPSAYFQTALFTGNGGTNAITNTGNSDLQPNWVWFKCRSAAEHHGLFDSVRGVTKVIYSNLSNAQDNLSDTLASFNSDGFTMGADSGSGGSFNGDTKTMAAWQWKAGTSFTNDASATGIGSLDSTASVNTTSGFSIVKYTGAGGTQSVAHGLSSVPKFILTKKYSGSAEGWGGYHSSLGNNQIIKLQVTDATETNTAIWNATTPTTSVFSIGADNRSNPDGETVIAYCFAEKKGYSKFGSYTANANVDGTFVYTGFKPAFLLIKNTSQATDWIMYDNKRDGYEPQNKEFRANTSAAERNAEDNNVQFCANGFKLRNAGTKSNADSGNTLIYMSFAEQPFVTSTGVPATAR